MAEPLEIPGDWPPEYIERLVDARVDRELERSLLGDRLEYADRRAHMPREVRMREDRRLRGGDDL